MKNLFGLFFVIFAVFGLVSCGGGEDTSEPEEKGIAVSLRGTNDLDIASIAEQIQAINFIIEDVDGNEVKQQSILKDNLGNQTTITGIKNVTNATLIVEALTDTTDRNSVKWRGRATGLKFEKGKTTEVKIQLYPTASNNESPMPKKLFVPRFGHTATLLSDGRILIAGGFTSCGSNHKCLATNAVEIIDPESGEVEKLADMIEPRALHKAALMDDGSVVFIGGVKGLNSIAQTEDEGFENYPLLPYSFSATSAVTKIEKYMPSYPKYNKKLNEPEISTSNTTTPVTAEIPFKAFQSILLDQPVENRINVFLVGGLDTENSEDSKGKPSNKAYTFSLANENGTITASAVTNLADSSEPMLFPALAHGNGSILAVGGRPGNSEYAASLISESSSENKGQGSGLNLFFTNNFAVGTYLYTFAGFNSEKGVEEVAETTEEGEGTTTEKEKAEIKYSNRILKWEVFSDSASFGQDSEGKEYQVYPGNTEVAFADTVYDEANERFILIGGTGASNVFQVINAITLERFQNLPSHLMKDSLVMPKAVIIPATKSPTGKTFIVITGGINSLDGTGTATASIKVGNI